MDKTPFKLITAAEHDAFLTSIDAANFEKSIQSQMKAVWSGFTNMFSAEADTPRNTASPKKVEESRVRRQRKEADSRFCIDVYQHLIHHTPSEGVSIQTMNQVPSP